MTSATRSTIGALPEDPSFRVRRAVLLVFALLASLLPVVPLVLDTAPSAAAGPCDALIVNEIACENSKPGAAPNQWDLGDGNGGDPTIQGFATDASVDAGATVRFKVLTPADRWHMDIYRLGYYGGSGARLITTIQPSVPLPQAQPACLNDAATGLVDCGNWAVSASWAVPSDAVSGFYIGRLQRDDTGGESDVLFIVRDDDGASDIVVQAADTTWQAYNNYGGNSLYEGSPAGRAFKVSFNRPMVLRGQGNFRRSNFFADEYPMVRWLEANGYDVSYISGVDSERSGASLLQHEMFMSSGHDEYWSAGQRANVEAARDAGVDLAFFSGNEVFWKTRWEPSIDGSGTPHRTLVAYKETSANAKIDPSSTWTGTWRDPRFSPPSDGGRPENALTGTMFTVNCCRADPIEVPAEEGGLRFWRNTSVASLASGQVATLPAGLLGYEWDEDVDNGFRPAGLMGLSSTTRQVESHLVDNGVTYAPGTATHKLTLYRAASGALVFGAGTVRWAFGLDGYHDDGTSTPDVRVQQATVNLLADMGAQPGTLQQGLVAASRSTDATAPSVTLSNPNAGASVVNGTPVTISGTATDSGGKVGAVEVSTDGGSTWHPAVGRGTWSYSWTAAGSGQVTIMVRASDDSGNLSAAVSRNITVSCPCTLFGGATPTVVDAGDAGARVELGVRFSPTTDGNVTGVRFYKAATNTGPHVGSLYRADGTLLARATFGTETASGWQDVSFSTPVAVTAGTTYVASYHTTAGHYAFERQRFASAIERPPLRAPAATPTAPNGVYVYASTPTFPSDSNSNTNASYGVDVTFFAAQGSGPDTTPPVVISTSPPSGAGDVGPASAVRAVLSEPVVASTVTFTVNETDGGAAVAGTVSHQPEANRVTFTPNGPLAYGTSYTARIAGGEDAAGNAMAPVSWSFTTMAAPSCPCTIFGSAVPPVVDSQDGSSLELGVRFRADVDGVVSGVRFHKASSNTGTHVGSLWTSTGTLLGRATFSDESTSGWQSVSFAQPVPVTAGTTYVASYFAPNGHYSYAHQQLAAEVSSPPLRALAAGVDGLNGVFRYGSTPAFPSDGNPNTNAGYGVDLIFSPGGSGPDTTAPTVVARTPAAGSTNHGVGSAVTAELSEPVVASTVAVSLRQAGSSSAVTGTVSYDAATRTASFVPAGPLAFATSYEATVSGATDPAGNVMAPVTWSFTTVTAPQCPCTLFGSQTPTTVDGGDGGSVELGVRFRADVSGVVTAVRFYKATANTGTHVGSLWASDGTLLARATFTNESASGWQEVAFANPVPVEAGQTYIASYFAPRGHYSYTTGVFATQVDSGPLHAPASITGAPNGVYRYAAAPTFPADGNEAADPSYWVDVRFESSGGGADVTPPGVTSTNPTDGATETGVSVQPSVVFDESVVASSVVLELRSSPGAPPLAGGTSYDPASRRATFVPDEPLTYGATYTAQLVAAADHSGNALVEPVSWTFSTGAPTCPCTLFGPDEAPTVASSPDAEAIEVGVRITPDVDGSLQAVRFYKGSTNTGTHTGSVWSSDGQLLATATFTNETEAGWQQVDLATPVAVSAGETYVVSYHTDAGHYAFTAGTFSDAEVHRSPLRATASAFGYGAASAFPGSTSTANYWVDAVFVTAAPPPPPPPPPPPAAAADLSLALAHSPATFIRGEAATYTATVANAGPDASTGQSLTLTLPAGITYTSASGSGWTCTSSGQVVSCTGSAPLAAGTSSAVSVVAQVGSTAAASSTATASVSGAPGDPATSNNSASDVAGVSDPTADLTGSITTSNLRRGRSANVSLTVRNDGPQPAAAPLTATVQLGEGLSYSSTSASGWSCTRSAQTVSCTRSAALAVGASAPTIRINVTVAAQAPSSTTTVATVSSPTRDPDAADNTITVVDRIRG